MANAEFKISTTRTKSYINEAGQVVNGFEVTFRLLTFNETHTINVPSLNQTVVENAIKAIVADRKNLSTL